MRRLAMAGLVLAVPSLAMAAGSHGVHTSAPTAALRARSKVSSGDAVGSDIPPNHPPNPSRALVHSRPHVPAHALSRDEAPGGNHIFANPVRREVTRMSDFTVGCSALPALVTLGVPVLLDVPGIGEVSVPEETYYFPFIQCFRRTMRPTRASLSPTAGTS